MIIPTFKYSLEGQDSERLYYRPLNDNDFEDWLPFCENEKSIQFMNFINVYSSPIVRCEKWFERVYNRYKNGLGGMNALIDKSTGKLVGQCGLLIHTIDGIEELEVGYSLLPSCEGKGYAIEAAQKCKAFAFENNFSDSIISIIHINNILSSKVAIKNGMNIDKSIEYNESPVNIYRVNR